ncbi:L,D-transpeptidase family protein [Apibacter muscae]|uniref:L,D-transpeptidase family protein n=1 Tax=Apibacter muscae TaxID=2509004 RepID=UPI00162329CE|nr:L,D-transpeptidase family protein [Apibacter muscae]
MGGDDGWNFRGKGLIQLTGRDNYSKANVFTKKYENVDILANSDLVAHDLKIAVLSTMAFFVFRNINIIAPKTRDVEGPLIVFDKSGVLFKTYSLCRGSNANRLKAGGNGDTPIGKASTRYDANAHKGEYSYGNYGLIYLEGLTSEFLTATKNGRAGIAIHSGHTTGYFKKSLKDLGKLMGTYGCVRVYNKEMEKLGKLYTKLKEQGRKIYCYIEDYDGNIKDVYAHYKMDLDSKDSSRGKRSTIQ